MFHELTYQQEKLRRIKRIVTFVAVVAIVILVAMFALGGAALFTAASSS